MQLIIHFQSRAVLSKQSLCFSYPIVKTTTSLPSNNFVPKSPIFTIPLSLCRQTQTQNPILCAGKNNRRNGSQRLTRLLLQLMPGIVSNFKIVPQPLDLVVEEFCGRDGTGGGLGIWKGLGGGGDGFGRKRKRKSLLLFVLYGVVVICGLGLLFCGDVGSNVLFCGLGFGLSGVAMVQWWGKIGIFAIFFGGVLVGLGFQRRGIAQIGFEDQGFLSRNGGCYLENKKKKRWKKRLKSILRERERESMRC